MPAVPDSPAVRAGLVLFAIGLLFVAIDVLPFFFGGHNTPLWLNLACLAAPLGFAIAVGSAIRSGRAAQRRAVDELSR
jgi:hypothetical protein